jgi:hypothetical protein
MSRRVSVSKKRNVLSRGASGATLSSSIVRPRPNSVNSVPASKYPIVRKRCRQVTPIFAKL